MRHRSKYVSAAALSVVTALLLAVPAIAGIHYEAITETDPEKGQTQRMKVTAWVEGESARIEFEESDNPMTSAGTYLLTNDAGNTLYLVNPEEKTYAEWDLNQMMAMVGNVMESVGPLLDMEISEPQVRRLLEEDGGEILGYDVTHYRYRTVYTMKMKVLGMGRENEVERLQDIWATRDPELQDAALGVWLRNAPVSTGNEQIDRLVQAEMEKIEGFPLRSEETQVVRGKKGKETTTVTRQEVTVLEITPVDGARFQIPPGYERVEMMPMAAGEEEEEGGGLRSLFGRDKGDG